MIYYNLCWVRIVNEKGIRLTFGEPVATSLQNKFARVDSLANC